MSSSFDFDLDTDDEPTSDRRPTRPTSRTGEEYPDASEGDACPEGCGAVLSAEEAGRGVCRGCEEYLAEGAADGMEDVARNGWPGEE